ncbi:2-oxoglutarate (2OG) and Fe(II)-dependent oxygenase superfamily protein [Abeliophyllum distichum]|uniref:2-oxoglutarate (2OG) and Fe(II)-dependent oxygenase superfamily protein n=1 Tax=Abeliophyllum distichum TaxID=126358 RepID=A0ABD1RCV7_9LAMI
MGSLTAPKLIVVDFTKEDMMPGSNSWSYACKDIRKALENHGCFIALYDKISPKLEKAIFHAADELFDLPTEVKIQNINEKPYHGYVGQMPIVPLHEGLGIDYATTLEGAQSFTKLMWPNGNDSFCESSMSFAKTVAELEKIVIRMLFESYSVEKYTDYHIESTTYLLRFLKYRAPKTNETTMAFPSHTDKSFLTILHQNHISGLEIKARDGEWITVEYPPIVLCCHGWRRLQGFLVINISHSVRGALKSYGCFIAVYKKFTSDLHDEMFESAKELFDLPMEAKVNNKSNFADSGYGGNFSIMPLFEYSGIENGANLEATKNYTSIMWPDGNDNCWADVAVKKKKVRPVWYAWLRTRRCVRAGSAVHGAATAVLQRWTVVLQRRKMGSGRRFWRPWVSILGEGRGS